jgi:hypothetical protein
VEIKVIASIQLNPDFDLGSYVASTIEQSKSNLAKDGQLGPSAFVIANGIFHAVALAFEDQSAKETAYRALVQFAKEQQADVLVTLNEAWYGEKVPISELYPGKLQEDDGKEVILLTVSGPSMQSYSYSIPFKRRDGTIDFSETRLSRDNSMHFLEGWPDYCLTSPSSANPLPSLTPLARPPAPANMPTTSACRACSSARSCIRRTRTR